MSDERLFKAVGPATLNARSPNFTDVRAGSSRRKGKKEYLYSAFYILCISQSAQAVHTVLPANTPCLPFLRKRSPDGATRN